MSLACVLFVSTFWATPSLDMPELEASEDVADATLVRGLQDLRLRQPGTVIGSYGQFNLEYVGPSLRDRLQGTATLKRLVLFVSHHFTDDVRGYVELEYENAVACSACLFGAAEVEQAFVDWDLAKDALTLRSGLILVPFGIINQWHEPPVFHGVNRPDVDTFVIPTTWRELGVGIAGRFADMYRYELYAMTAPDAMRLGSLGLRRATTQGSHTPANAYMLAGRIEVEPLLGVVVGLSGIAGDLKDATRIVDGPSGRLPLYGAGLDARWRRQGWEARAVYASFWFPNAAALMDSRDADGGLVINPTVTGTVPTRFWGAYGEVAYNVLHALGTPQALLPFIRLEYFDTQAGVPAGFERDAVLEVLETTFGVSYRPLQQLVFKGDVQLLSRRAGDNEARLNAGMGYMF